MPKAWVWLKRLVTSLWVGWLSLKELLGLPENVEEAKEWRRILTDWGVWNVVIDPIGPMMLLVAFALLFWAWDVPARAWGKLRPVATPHQAEGEAQLVEVRDRRFYRETVRLDGKRFTHCVFEQVTFVYAGGRYGLVKNTFVGSHRLVAGDDDTSDQVNQAMGGLMQLMSALGCLKRPIIDRDFKPIDPGITYIDFGGNPTDPTPQAP